ncbi:MAG: TPM domain-containing protein [Candidatus Margulisbacteria bacterium]|jgi:uncharacterized membrane protein YgcG|nr:TPM domain-containing protein [Candidatus Margulisiibacteriota bacterium]
MKKFILIFCLLGCALPLQAEETVDDAIKATQQGAADMQQSYEKLKKYEKLAPAQQVRYDQLPDIKRPINDYGNVVGTDLIVKLGPLVSKLKKYYAVDFRVLVMPMIDTPDFPTYCQQLYDHYDVGGKAKGQDHGVLLVVSVLDRRVKIITGNAVAVAVTAQARVDIEQRVMAELTTGQFGRGVEIGVTSITELIDKNWPRTAPAGVEFDWQKASWPLFLLVIFAVALTLVVGGGVLMAFGTIVGGAFGYMFLGTFGLITGSLLGFLIFYNRNESSEFLEMFTEQDDDKTKNKPQSTI